MNISFNSGIITIITNVPAAQKPIKVVEVAEDKTVTEKFVYELSQGNDCIMKDFYFQGNAVIDGCIAGVILTGEGFKFEEWKKRNKYALIAAARYESSAIEVAKAKAAKEAEDEALYNGLFNM